jgi:hypothetical protein
MRLLVIYTSVWVGDHPIVPVSQIRRKVSGEDSPRCANFLPVRDSYPQHCLLFAFIYLT